LATIRKNKTTELFGSPAGRASPALLIIFHALLSVVAAVELLVFHLGQRNDATVI
jgi:hypothetical protein